MSESLKQAVIIENKPGAEEIIGEDFVAKSPPDGYTVLITAANIAVNPSTRSKLPFDPQRDFQPVAQIATLPYVAVINPKVPAKNLPELVAYSRKQASGLNAGVGGTANRLVTELFRLSTNANLVLIPYKAVGRPLCLVARSISRLQRAALAQFVLNGRLTALAIAGDKRLSLLPVCRRRRTSRCRASTSISRSESALSSRRIRRQKSHRAPEPEINNADEARRDRQDRAARRARE